LDQPIKIFVRSLERWWQMNLRCLWLESLVSSLVFKSSNWRMVHLWVNASTSKTHSRSLEWKMQNPLAHLWEQWKLG
jgi:hypothetical protein